MKLLNAPRAALALFLALSLAACGSATTSGTGTIVVSGLAPDQELLCASGQGGPGGNTVILLGSGFLAEAGSDIVVTWTALNGTPFDGGSSATTETAGTVLSDTQVEAGVPNGVGDIEVTITIMLPGGNSGTSEPQEISIGGFLVGPFALNDNNFSTIGNIPTGVAAPGVLANDIPAFCANEEERKPAAGGSTRAAADFVVITPPAGFENDATPGVAVATNLGGSVTIQADGSFTYAPPVGVTGVTDQFNYWMQEGTRGPDRATVRIQLSDMVWFIDSKHEGANNGHFDSPFQSIDDFMAVQFGGEASQLPDVGHTIFIYSEGNGDAYDGGLSLMDQQRVVGERSGLTMNMLPIVPPGTAPTLTNSGAALGESVGTVIQLGNQNEVRGVDIRAPAASGIRGFGVSGPTVIDEVDIRGTFEDAIQLDAITGSYTIGAAGTFATPRVVIQNVFPSATGIRISGQNLQPTATSSALGAAAEVHNTRIENPDTPPFDSTQGSGIACFDANLALTETTVDGFFRGIFFITTNGLCTLTAGDCDLGTTTPQRYRGFDLDPTGFGAIQADISNCESHSDFEALYAGSFAGGSLQIAFNNNTFQNLVTGNIPAVQINGLSGTPTTTITSMDSNRVVGNNTGGGMWFNNCLFDAFPGAVGVPTVNGGVTQIGTSSAARVEDTALGLFGCSGALTFTSVTIFQDAIGSPTGWLNTGSLTLDLGTLTADVLP